MNLIKKTVMGIRANLSLGLMKRVVLKNTEPRRMGSCKVTQVCDG